MGSHGSHESHVGIFVGRNIPNSDCLCWEPFLWERQVCLPRFHMPWTRPRNLIGLAPLWTNNLWKLGSKKISASLMRWNFLEMGVYNGKPCSHGWFLGTTIFGNIQIDMKLWIWIHNWLAYFQHGEWFSTYWYVDFYSHSFSFFESNNGSSRKATSFLSIHIGTRHLSTLRVAFSCLRNGWDSYRVFSLMNVVWKLLWYPRKLQHTPISHTGSAIHCSPTMTGIPW